MPRNRQSDQSSHMANANLYCAQCENQIGIFENEWIRLTSSYARSKEPGTHLATEIGQRLQQVPSTTPVPAAGCQMSEVFCRKCSNMVGQYCKVIAKPEQQELLCQYFYKLSRTFLKDSKTNKVLDPVYTYDPDHVEPSRERSSSIIRQSNPSLRWQNTPLRQSSSTPVTVQAAANSRVRTQDAPGCFALNNDTRMNGSTEPQDETESEQNERQAGKSDATQNRRQSSRLIEREGRVFEIEGRLRFHEGRLIDQENFLNDQSARMHEQDIVIEEQRTRIEGQERQMEHVNNQLVILQQSMDDLRASLHQLRQGQCAQEVFHVSASATDLAGQFESMANAIRLAGRNTEEVQQLRAENQALKGHLASITGSFNPPDFGREIGFTTSSAQELQPMQALGKRKRAEQYAEQVPTPQSDRSAQPSPIQPATSDNREAQQGLSRIQDQVPIQVESVRTDMQSPPMDVQNLKGQTSKRKPPARKSVRYSNEPVEVIPNTRNEMSTQEITTNDEASPSVTLNSVSDMMSTHLPAHSSVHAPTVHMLSNDQPPVQALAINSVAEVACNTRYDGDAMQIDPMLHPPQMSTAGASTDQGLQMLDGIQQMASAQADIADSTGNDFEFVQDTTAFDDLAFSDEEDDDNDDGIFNRGDDDDNDIASTTAEEFTNPRVDRSPAPEPLLKPKPPANRTRTYITLDRAHIATPYVFWYQNNHGQHPRALRPPAIQTRKKDLEDELRALGLAEWINKNKKTKEYREAVSTARAKFRAAKKAALLSSNGLHAVDAPPETSSVVPTQSPILNDIHNIPAAPVHHLPALQVVVGDENAQPLSKLTSNDPSNQATDAASTNLSPRQTRRAARGSGTHTHAPEANSQVHAAEPDPTQDDPPAKRTKAAGRAKKQRNSDAANVMPQVDTTKKGRGRPRKSAPAVMDGPAKATEAATLPASTPANDLDQTSAGSSAVALRDTNESGSAVLTASKQKLLEKMRLKALQKEPVSADLITARDKLAEEAMAAMEMDGVMV